MVGNRVRVGSAQRKEVEGGSWQEIDLIKMMSKPARVVVGKAEVTLGYLGPCILGPFGFDIVYVYVLIELDSAMAAVVLHFHKNHPIISLLVSLSLCKSLSRLLS